MKTFHTYMPEFTAVFLMFCMCFVQNIECHEHVENGAENSSFEDLMKVFDIRKTTLEATKNYTIHGFRFHQELFNSKPVDCAEIFKINSSAKSAIYQIYPRNRIVKGPISVYCDMEDDGGGWTVLQRRGNFNSAVDYFFRDWNNYKNGFGNLLKDFWIGNDNIFALTNQVSVSLKFNLSDWDGNVTYALYDEFWMDDEYHNYTSHVAGFRGTAGDSFSFTNGAPFTTKDRHNNQYEHNCALIFKGAWWYTACHISNLNGLYLKGAHESFADGVNWATWRGYYYSLKTTEIKIRPKDFLKMVPINKETLIETDM